jgi:hypothetical protein
VLAGWHLLSLDAPTVAVVWTWFAGLVVGAGVRWTDLAAMFCAVWVLYAADRLLDARALRDGGDAGELERRHLFHDQHRRWFRWGIAAGCIALAALLPAIRVEEVRLYLVIGALLVGWFAVIHSGRKPLLKEFVVGVFFAAAVFVPAVSRMPWMRGALVLPAVLFGALCSLNCLFIFAWEHEGGGLAGRRFAGQWVGWVGAGLGAIALGLMPLVGASGGRILQAVGLSAALLVTLHCLRRRVERTTLRALADLVLLTPLLVRWWAR